MAKFKVGDKVETSFTSGVGKIEKEIIDAFKGIKHYKVVFPSGLRVDVKEDDMTIANSALNAAYSKTLEYIMSSVRPYMDKRIKGDDSWKYPMLVITVLRKICDKATMSAGRYDNSRPRHRIYDINCEKNGWKFSGNLIITGLLHRDDPDDVSTFDEYDMTLSLMNVGKVTNAVCNRFEPKVGDIVFYEGKHSKKKVKVVGITKHSQAHLDASYRIEDESGNVFTVSDGLYLSPIHAINAVMVKVSGDIPAYVGDKVIADGSKGIIKSISARGNVEVEVTEGLSKGKTLVVAPREVKVVNSFSLSKSIVRNAVDAGGEPISRGDTVIYVDEENEDNPTEFRVTGVSGNYVYLSNGNHAYCKDLLVYNSSCSSKNAVVRNALAWKAKNAVRGNTKLKSIDYWFADNGYGDDTLVKYVAGFKKNRCVDFVDRLADSAARDAFYDAMYQLTGIKSKWAMNTQRKARNAITFGVGNKVMHRDSKIKGTIIGKYNSFLWNVKWDEGFTEPASPDDLIFISMH